MVPSHEDMKLAVTKNKSKDHERTHTKHNGTKLFLNPIGNGAKTTRSNHALLFTWYGFLFTWRKHIPEGLPPVVWLKLPSTMSE